MGGDCRAVLLPKLPLMSGPSSERARPSEMFDCLVNALGEAWVLFRVDGLGQGFRMDGSG
jgi:hypothetical protein